MLLGAVLGNGVGAGGCACVRVRAEVAVRELGELRER